MTYFHTGCSTIIGAKSFHGPVRDGKGWYQLAMVIRHNLLLLAASLKLRSQTTNLGRSSVLKSWGTTYYGVVMQEIILANTRYLSITELML